MDFSFTNHTKNLLAESGGGIIDLLRVYVDVDLFDFWYETSLVYFFKFDTGSYTRKNICGPKMPKTPFKLTGVYISNNKLTLNFELCLFGKSTK